MELFINGRNRKTKQKVGIDDFEEMADELLTDFVEKLTDPYVKQLSTKEKEDFAEGAEWLFTPKGAALYKRYQKRLRGIGNRYFGKEDMFFIRITASCVSDF
jgi:hypothetical protein